MNEETNEASSSDAPAEAPAPAPAPAPVSAPAPANPVNTKTASRFYSRLRRGILAPAQPAGATPAPTEGLTADQAIHLKDNLPVRATMGDRAEYQPPEGGGAPRGDRERDRDRDRNFGEGRGGRERRGRGRDRDRDREGGGRNFDRDRPRERDRDRGFDRPGTSTPAVAGAPVDTGEEWDRQKLASEPAGAPAANASAPGAASPTAAETPPAPRKLRFEDAPVHESQRAVQEFRPSRDRSYAEQAERARREQREDAEEAGKEKGAGLFGWMKSIFGAKPGEATEAAPEAQVQRRNPERNRGPRPYPKGGAQPHAGNAAGAGSAAEGEHGGKRRRRRRRGGRNRHRHGEGHGGGGPEGGHSEHD